MKISKTLLVVIVLSLCLLSDILHAQFIVLMENYPPNSYFEDAPSKISNKTFYSEILNNLKSPEEKKQLREYYSSSAGNDFYSLNEKLSEENLASLKVLLVKAGYIKAKGFEVEITQEIFRRMGIKPVYRQFPWARCIEMMRSGDADAILTVFKTDEREKFLFYPETFTIREENGFFKLKSSNINFSGDLGDIKPFQIAVKSLTSYGRKFDGATYLQKKETPFSEDVIRLVENHRVPLGIGPVHMITYLSRKMGSFSKFSFLKPYLSRDPVFIGFSKKRNHKAITDEFSRVLKEFKKTSQYKRILSKYDS